MGYPYAQEPQPQAHPRKEHEEGYADDYLGKDHGHEAHCGDVGFELEGIARRAYGGERAKNRGHEGACEGDDGRIPERPP